jgi:DNA-binding NtrC family response regulator
MAHKRILLVDDRVSVLFLFKAGIERMGADYQVVTATDGLAALNELERRPFDLVVTDYSMPRMNGLELLRAIRLRQPGMCVIMFTGSESEALKAEARRLRVYRFLSKSLDVGDFFRVVRQALSNGSG